MRELSFVEIARLLERKQGSSLVGLARETVPLAEGWMIFDGQGSPVNKACGIGLGRPLTEAEIDGIVTFFTERGAEPTVELCPFVPPALIQALGKRGFILREFMNALIRDLPAGGEPRAMLTSGWPSGITVERVDPSDAALVREFAEVSSSGFLPEGMAVPEVFLDFSTKASRLPGYDLFVAREGRTIVGAGGCESGEGVTLLYGTSVKPAWRRRGIQQALIAARLERGRERGSRLAVINSGPGIPTERNATRLGFAMAYTRVVLVKPGPGLTPSL
ncbi:MAG: GNAT family N-acetyltransferase [Myxococcaceae bacterium]|nr:GNAT family N-acetyltransferase [Myxococcaceae bacterium]